MRILNRPMFRYGGPIKEGVMHGMRDGGRTIAGGNQIGMPMGNRTGFQDPQWKFGETGLGKTLKFLNPKPLIDDTFNLTANQLSKFITGYNPGLSWKKSKRLERDMWDKMRGRDPLKRTGRMTDDEVNKVFFTSAKKGWTTPSMQEGPTAAEIELAKLKKQIADQKKGTMPENLGTKAWIDPNKATKLAKEQQGERVQKYLKMMGYDSAKKGALSDALIDASALVQDASTEAGALKHADWGKLINRMIQTTSKRLDKPAQIREAVGLMATKAAIEKDLEDPAVAKLRLLKIKESEKALEGSKASSIGEIIPTVLKSSGKSRADAEVMKDVMSIKEPDMIATIVGKKDDLQDIKDASDFTTIEDYIVNEYEGKEGIYIIDNVVVQIDENGVADRIH